jgi:hypothetical protein
MSWKFAWFNSFRTAKDYADNYLGNYGPYPFEGEGKFDYSGYGDVLEIRRIN